MWIDSIDVDGLRWAPEAHDLGSVCCVAGGTQVALVLWALALDEGRAEQALPWLWEGAILDPSEEPGGLWEVALPASYGFQHQVADQNIQIEVRAQLDPLLYRQLQNASIRQPTLALALAEDATITVKVGWLVTSDGHRMRPGLLALTVGSHPIPVQGKERPAWVRPFLREVSSRVGWSPRWPTVELVARRLQQASESPSPARRKAVGWVLRDAHACPLALESLSWVGRGPELDLAVGESLQPVRLLGSEVVQPLSSLVELHLSGVDVLIMPHGLSEDWTEFLTVCLERTGAPAEQVVGVSRT